MANNNKGMKPKKIGNAEFFVNGVVVVNNTIESIENPFSGNPEYQLCISINLKDTLSVNTLSQVEKQLQISLQQNCDNECIYLYTKSKKPIPIIDNNNNATILKVGDVVTAFINVVLWEFGNQINTAIYSQGAVKIGESVRQSLFEKYQDVQKTNQDYTKSLECYQYNNTKQLQPPIYPNEYNISENEENINFNDLPQITL